MLWLIKPLFASGNTLFADSWFGSLRNAAELMNREIESLVVVITAHRFYPKELKALQLS